MKDLFNFIKARINEQVPEIKTVRLYNIQTNKSNSERKEKAFPYPACFIEFAVNDVQNFILGIKNVNLTVRFRFALESYKFERLDDLDFQDKFDRAIQFLRGGEGDLVQFSTFQEVITDLDEDFDNVNEPVIEYQTMWRKKSAYSRVDSIETGPIAPDVTGILIDDFDPKNTADSTELTADIDTITADAA